MSNRTTDPKSTPKTAAQDGLGIVLSLLGGFFAVSVFLSLRGHGSASLLSAPVRGLVGTLGPWAALGLSAGIAGLGVVLFLGERALAPGRHALGIAGVGVALAFLVGAAAPAAGGALGSLAPELLGDVAGRVLGLLVGLVVLGASAWAAWSMRVPLPVSKPLTPTALVPPRRAEADGVSAAEALALQPERVEPPATSSGRDAGLRPLERDVRLDGGVPVGAVALDSSDNGHEFAPSFEEQDLLDRNEAGGDESEGLSAGEPEPFDQDLDEGDAEDDLLEYGGVEAELEEEPDDLTIPESPVAAASWELPEEDEEEEDESAPEPDAPFVDLELEAADADVLAAEDARVELESRTLEPVDVEEQESEVHAEVGDEDEEPYADEDAEEDEELELHAEGEDDEDEEEYEDAEEDEELGVHAEDDTAEDEEEYEDAEELGVHAEDDDDEGEEEYEDAEEDEELEVHAEDDDDEGEEEYEGEAAAEDEELEVHALDEDEEDEELEVHASDDEEEDEAAELEEPQAEPERVPEGAEVAEGEAAPVPAALSQAGLFDADQEPEVVLEPARRAPKAPRKKASKPKAPRKKPAKKAPEPGHSVAAELVVEAGDLILEHNRVAVSMLQRNFELDFDRACLVLDRLQDLGLIGPYVGGRTREILLSPEEWRELASEVAST